MPTHDTIAVIDFGGQYAHLIANKVRRLGVLAVIRDPQDPLERFQGMKGIILSGSPALASEGEESNYTRAIYDLPIPILGFCFGHQEIAKQYGGAVEHRDREYGHAALTIVAESPIFAGLGPVEDVFMSHGDTVVAVGEGFVELGTSRLGDGPVHRYAAIADHARHRYGFQYHPEVDDTVHGSEMLANFAVKICGCRPTWRIDAILDELTERIRQDARGKDVFLLASGGVDSTVCAWLLHRALGPERLHLLHIDNGMMRLEESRKVVDAFRAHDVSRHVHFVDATDRFLAAIGEAIEPEKKRHAIGNTFIDVFKEEAERLGLRQFLLAQGTIYPDTVETGGTSRADVIKTHHNRVPIIEEMIAAGQVLEPLADFYKVEVRELGAALGIPEAFIVRHPFPGPGLGVRLLCNDGAPEGQDLPALTAGANAVSRPRGITALPLPVRSVGVKADLRCYESPVLLHAPGLTHADAVTCAGEIWKTVPGINRCVVAVAPAAPRTARALPRTRMTRERLDVLRRADDAVMRGLARHGLMEIVWQCPTVLVPVALDDRPGELVVIRPVLSERAMTARPAPLPDALLRELSEAIMSLPGVSGVVLDVTSKPPGTIEWE